MFIDKYAYINNLKEVHPIEKTCLSLLSLIACLVFNSLGLYIFVIISMAFLILWSAKIPAKVFVKVILIPLPFLIISVLTIMLNITKDPEFIEYGFRVYSWFFGFTKHDIFKGVYVFFRSLSAVFSIYFLSFTTPIVDIVWILKKAKLPSVFIELLTIVYRFIFVLLEAAFYIKTAQKCRLGYSNIKRSYISLSQLVVNLFKKAYQNHKMLYISLISRGYTGELKVLEENYRFSIKNIVFICTYTLILLTIVII